jgi:hypothetical protein
MSNLIHKKSHIIFFKHKNIFYVIALFLMSFDIVCFGYVNSKDNENLKILNDNRIAISKNNIPSINIPDNTDYVEITKIKLKNKIYNLKDTYILNDKKIMEQINNYSQISEAIINYKVLLPESIMKTLKYKYSDIIIYSEVGAQYSFIKTYKYTQYQTPFIVIGDFNGDKIKDVALQTNHGIMIFISDNNEYICKVFDGVEASGIELQEATNLQSPWEEFLFILDYDSIKFIIYESSAFLLYFTPNDIINKTFSISQYWISD